MSRNQNNLKGMKLRTKTLKLAVLLLGKTDHFELIKKMDLGTQNDITQKGMSLIMPMILGALAGFMFSKETFGYGPFISICVGLVIAFFVMIVDRSFLNKIGAVTRKGRNLRIFVSVLLAVVSSSGIDLALYHNDIQEEIREIASERTNTGLKTQELKLAELNQAISEKESEALQMKEIYLAEMVTGVGQRAKAKKAMYEAMQADVNQMKIIKGQLLAQMSSSKLEYEQAMVEEMQGSMLIKMEALHRVVFSSISTGLYWFLLLALVVSFDLLPLMVKNKDINAYDQFMNAEVQRGLTLHKPLDPVKSREAYLAFSAKQDAARRGGQSVVNGFNLN
ncbi:DUF4407 domain-containing protein [Schleiferiaceae bacterium]|nr:DUF4407 domain-containing protein [Schleiferiaceae bacterium]